MSIRLIASGIAMAACVAAVYAGVIAADSLPLPNRVATADAVVFGKVTGFEAKTTSAPAYPGAPNKVDYKVATIEVTDAVTGVKNVKTVRLGFTPPPPGVFISPRPFLPEVGMEGCFFLTKAAPDLMIAPGPLTFVSAANPGYDKEAALIKKCGKILENPDTALKGKDAEDRFIAAAMLVARYTTRRSPKDKQEPIDAAQSKLIMEAIAGADWTPQNDITKLSPRMVISKFPLTAKDGWAPPKDGKMFNEYAQRWATDQAGTYRIQKWVSEK